MNAPVYAEGRQNRDRYVASDPRVECVMVPIRDGVTIIRLVG